MADNSIFVLEPKGMFNSGVVVKDHEQTLFSTAANWKGQIIITDIAQQCDYVLKMKRIFSNSFILTDSGGKELFCIKQLFNWKHFRASYEIELTNFDLFHKQDEILLFTAFYGYKNLVASVSAGTN